MQHDQNSDSGATAFVDRHLPAQDVNRGGNGYGYGQSQTMMVSMEAVRAIIWRQRYVLLAVIGSFLLAGLVFTLLQAPSYQSTAKVRVNTFNSAILEGQDLLDPYVPGSLLSTYLETLKEVIESRSMALRVVDLNDLQDNESLLGAAATAIAASETSPEAAKEARRQAAADIVRSGLVAETPIDSQIIAITYTSTDRNLAARIANGYAESFLLEDMNQSLEANSYAREYLEGEIEEVRAELNNAEMQAIDYARSNRIIGQPLSVEGDTATAGTAPTLTAANLVEINQRYTEARVKRIAAEQRWAAVSNTPAAQLPEVQQSGAIQTLRSQLAQRNGQLADLRERYKDDYPEVRELRSEIKVVEGEIASASQEVKSGIRNDFDVARRQESGLLAELSKVSSASLDEQDRRVEYSQIDREVDALRSQLATLMERHNQISAATNLRSSKVSLLDAALVATSPSSPNLIKNMIVALVLGIGLAGVVALLREVIDDRLRSIEDVETSLGLPALGQTPYIPTSVNNEVENGFSPISEAYSSIRATLDYRLGSRDGLVIQFTSSRAAEGKTTSSAAIARKFAEVGRKVLLIDMDLRRPAISGMFDHKRTELGVVDVLYRRKTLKNSVFQSSTENLDVLPVGGIPSNPVEILSSGLVAEMLQEAKRSYDVIIVDSSPVLGIADAPLLSRFVDAVVMIVDADCAHSRETRAAIRRLHDMDANVVGAIVTKFRALEVGQGYNYQYDYYSYGSES